MQSFSIKRSARMLTAALVLAVSNPLLAQAAGKTWKAVNGTDAQVKVLWQASGCTSKATDCEGKERDEVCAVKLLVPGENHSFAFPPETRGAKMKACAIGDGANPKLSTSKKRSFKKVELDKSGRAIWTE